ncbi:MAG: methyltransferase domain-containing protein [Gallionella sp.]|nr:methyltransferase domain-containing protein [Gallionella sp.]
MRTEPLSGELLIDFGLQPVSNRFLHPDSTDVVPDFSLQLRIDADTGLIHLGTPFPVEALKPRYDWLTCFEPEDHLDDLARQLVALPEISPDSVFGAYSFKDDSMLRRLERLGYANTWRIDPAEDLAVTDPCANVETYQRELTTARALAIAARRGRCDVMIVRHVAEHAHDLPAFIDAIRVMVKPRGYIVWEVPDCERVLTMGDCTTVWEEHQYYFTRYTFRRVLIDAGFTVVDYASVPYVLENSLVAIVQEGMEPAHSDDPLAVAAEMERARHFVQKIQTRSIAVHHKLEHWRRTRGEIALFGAGHLSCAFLSLMQASSLMCCVIDDNPNKKGLQMPVGGLHIAGSEVLNSGRIGVCLLGLNPLNQAGVIAKHQKFVDQGGIFASIFPGSALDLELR